MPATALLEFDPHLNRLTKTKALRDGLSAVAQIGPTLWMANDETLSLERLSFLGDSGSEYRFGEHVRFPLADYLELPAPHKSDEKKAEEADIEGLAYSEGYLWLVGSHSRKRSQPKPDDSNPENVERLAKIGHDGNRFLLARIPVIEQDGRPTLAKTAGDRRAARLRGGKKGNALTEAVKKDAHLSPFLKIPGKDNGFDIEGLAVNGKRIFLGLRGPVLRGWAVILELEPEEDASSATLALKKIADCEDMPYRKHFLRLDGLGIRELCVDGTDLLILAGPTLDLDGPVRLFRWQGGAQPHVAGLVHDSSVAWIMDLPHGRGVDHAEGLIRFHPPGDAAGNRLLAVYDAAAPERFRGTHNAVIADIFDLER